MRCFLPTQIPDHLARCLTGEKPAYHVYLRFMVEVAHDTYETMTRYDLTDLTVVTPTLAAAVEGPSGRWGIDASMLVDVISQASADLVATASQRGPEVRYAPTLGGHRKLGDVDVAAQGSFSRRSDRLSASVGGGVLLELRRKTILPSLDYTFSYDRLGRAGTPLAVYSHDVFRHTIAAATTFVLDEATILVPTLSVVIENGDTSAPYLHIPVFSATDAARVPAGATVGLVDQIRLAYLPLERLPGSRQRVALSGLFARRFSSTTLRAEERLYVDGWGIKASTTLAQSFFDAGARVRLWPEVRAHVQSGADFWRLAYVASPTSSGPMLPALRAGQLDLGPLVSVTGGAGARFALDEKRRFALTVSGDVSYTRFLDHLYVVDRIGYSGTTALEADVP